MIIRDFTLIFVLITVGHAIPFEDFEKDDTKCGYESCHPVRDDMINVHIVPHTHDDVGWLKTVDQYYYGSNSFIQLAGVQYILDSVMDALRKDPNRRFIYVETAYLWKWWRQQHDVVKHQFQRYVRSGQLEIIGGAWTMNDEAVTHYQSIIDQFTWGLRKLNDTFGKCGRPKVGWQIDPFGHSREMASIFAQLGFDGLLLGRIDYQDKYLRFTSKSPEMVWQGSGSLGNTSRLFTSVMYNTYSPPPGFCFDLLCMDEPIIDDKKSPDYNVDKRVNDFLAYVKNVTKVYTTSNVIITMGNDFNYQDAHVWFKNLDKLIFYANKLQANGSKYNLIYSTPSCYLKAVYDQSKKTNLQFQVKNDDFFPYASDPHSYWTGYFTSKPSLKRFERLGNNFLQVCKQLYALTNLGPEDWADLNGLREAMGVMQHHDAITGTEKEHVAHDYARILSKGFDECEFVAATALSKIVTNNTKASTENDPAPEIPFSQCLLTNISQCEHSEKLDRFVVTVYNPLSRPVSNYIRLPVEGRGYRVTNSYGQELTVQLLPISDSIKNIPGRKSNATAEIVFLATSPPLGFESYYVEKVNKEMSFNEEKRTNSDYEDIGISINRTTGLLASVFIDNKTIPIEQNFLYYRGTVGDNREPKNRSSGAYIFRPNGTNAYIINEKPSFRVFSGMIVIEVHQTFSNWLSQIIRIYKNEYFVEFDWIIGPIPIDDVNGKEIITRFKTKLNSESTFYTDSNGREMLKRVRNFRPTWRLNLTEPITSNYYPVPSKIRIRDPRENLEVAILTDRTQGGTSLRDGEIELMVHRNSLHDDAFGVGEALQEQAFGVGLVIRGSHYLVAGSYNGQDSNVLIREKDLSQRKLLSAWTFISPTNNLTFKDYRAKYVMKYSGLSKALPANVQILTLEPWKGTSLLLRLEHTFEKDEGAYSKPVTVNLKSLFEYFEIASARETTLGANQWLDENERLVFNAGGQMEDVVRNMESYEFKGSVLPPSYINDTNWEEGWKKWNDNQLYTNHVNTALFDDIQMDEEALGRDGRAFVNNLEITLNPMQIRTFVIDVKRRF